MAVLYSEPKGRWFKSSPRNHISPRIQRGRSRSAPLASSTDYEGFRPSRCLVESRPIDDEPRNPALSSSFANSTALYRPARSLHSALNDPKSTVRTMSCRRRFGLRAPWFSHPTDTPHPLHRVPRAATSCASMAERPMKSHRQSHRSGVCSQPSFVYTESCSSGTRGRLRLTAQSTASHSKSRRRYSVIRMPWTVRI